MKLTLIGTEKRDYRSDGITLLRGIACIYVFCCHLFGGWSDYVGWISDIAKGMTKFTQPVPETNIGVIFFIVLSGYCIQRKGIDWHSKSEILGYYKKRLVRILPVLLASILLGIVLWYVSFDKEFTSRLTMTHRISTIQILMKVTGINAIMPFGYFGTYLGNAALVTVAVELYLYLIYPFVLFLDEAHPFLWKVIFFVIWAAVLLSVVHYGKVNWWENICLINFIPMWYLGGCANHHNVRRIWLVPLIITYGLLFIPYRNSMINSEIGLLLLSELRKYIIVLVFIVCIECMDKKESINMMTFGIYDIGKISYSLYAVHAPIIIFLIGARVDLISVIVLTVAVGVIWYEIFEVRISKLITRRGL